MEKEDPNDNIKVPSLVAVAYHSHSCFEGGSPRKSEGVGSLESSQEANIQLARRLYTSRLVDCSNLET